jgi:hypothetical protein
LSHVGTRPRNRFAQNEANRTDQASYQSTWFGDECAKGIYTPSEFKPLVKDLKGNSASCAFSYSSVVGMLLYLSGYTRPHITFAVNCCAQYMFCPQHLHDLALKIKKVIISSKLLTKE